tara:strand:+ start:896 stop:1060 length:165 start_codon:yes stop_codon:yes gene_type:complete
MADVTSGKNLTVIVLDETEAEALSRLLHDPRVVRDLPNILGKFHLRELATALGG